MKMFIKPTSQRGSVVARKSVFSWRYVHTSIAWKICFPSFTSITNLSPVVLEIHCVGNTSPLTFHPDTLEYVECLTKCMWNRVGKFKTMRVKLKAHGWVHMRREQYFIPLHSTSVNNCFKHNKRCCIRQWTLSYNTCSHLQRPDF